MADIKPFKCVRPAAEYAADVAALPYDVYNRQEAKKAVEGRPLSFLNIDRAETQFDDRLIHMLTVYMIKRKNYLKARLPEEYLNRMKMMHIMFTN